MTSFVLSSPTYLYVGGRQDDKVVLMEDKKLLTSVSKGIRSSGFWKLFEDA